MNVSKYLGKVIGIYLSLVSIAMFVNMPQFINSVNKLINDSGLMFVAGLFALFLGILLIVSHNIWQWSWRVIVTLFAWIAFLKGASIIFYPQFLDKATMLLIQNINVAYAAASFDLVLGLLLIYFAWSSDSER